MKRLDIKCIQHTGKAGTLRLFAPFFKNNNKFLTIWLQSKNNDAIIETNEGTKIGLLHDKMTKTYILYIGFLYCPWRFSPKNRCPKRGGYLFCTKIFVLSHGQIDKSKEDKTCIQWVLTLAPLLLK